MSIVRVWGVYVRYMTSYGLWWGREEPSGGYMVGKFLGVGVLADTTLDFFIKPHLDKIKFINIYLSSKHILCCIEIYYSSK